MNTADNVGAALQTRQLKRFRHDHLSGIAVSINHGNPITLCRLVGDPVAVHVGDDLRDILDRVAFQQIAELVEAGSRLNDAAVLIEVNFRSVDLAELVEKSKSSRSHLASDGLLVDGG